MLYNDPTRHREELGNMGNQRSVNCRKYSQYCNESGKPKSPDELAKMRNKPKGGGNPWDDGDPWDEAWASWTTDSYPWHFPVAGSWGDIGPQEIDPMEFEQMLQAVGDDLQGFPTFGWYDTPFFNASGDLTGVGCVNGKCYDRSELNYIGEGEALARLGFSREMTQNIVWAWKNKKAIVLGTFGVDSTTTEVSQGTKEMTDIGWNYYTANYKIGGPYPWP